MLFSVAVFAQSTFDLRYDTSSVVTLSGTVLTTVTYDPGNPSTAPESMMNSPEDNVPSVQPGDTLYVHGSKVNIGGNLTIVATTVEESEHTIALRSNTGVALFPTFTPTTVPSPPK